MTRSFDVFFDLRLNKRLCKQSWGWWFETLSRPLWRHCNALRHSWNTLTGLCHYNGGLCWSRLWLVAHSTKTTWPKLMLTCHYQQPMEKYSIESLSKSICLSGRGKTAVTDQRRIAFDILTSLTQRSAHFITTVADALAPNMHQVINNHRANSHVNWVPNESHYATYILHYRHYTNNVGEMWNRSATHWFLCYCRFLHDDVMKWKHFPCYWPFVPFTGEFSAQKPVTRSFDVFFDLRLNKRLGKQSWGWWF